MIKKGEVYYVPFPYSSLVGYKVRPSIVLTDESELGEDFLVSAVTSRFSQHHRISLAVSDFVHGSLARESFVHYSNVYTVHRKLMYNKVGKISQRKIKQICTKIQELLA